MPYSSVSELPSHVRNALTVHQQEIFLAAFNAAHKDGKSEGSCFKIAWAAVERSRESSRSDDKVRMLNRDLGMESYIEVDGGLLVKDVPLLAVGTWRDSNVRTSLYYPADVLRKYADNWYSYSYWSRHSGGVPRSILDLIGEARNVRFDPNYKENGMVEPGAILGDVFYDYSTQQGKDAAAKALARAKANKPLAVSVEHGGGEIWNPVTKRNEATSLWFSGLASVERGACERCNLPRANENGDAGGPGANDMNDEEFKQALADLKAEILAEVDAKIAAAKDKPEAEPSAEMSKLSAALDGSIKELEKVKKENEGYAKRLEALEKRPSPRTVPENERDLEELVVPEGYTVRRN